MCCQEGIDFGQGPHHVVRTDGADAADAETGRLRQLARIDDDASSVQKIVEGWELEPSAWRYQEGDDDRRLQCGLAWR
jgi:hypothetical protein